MPASPEALGGKDKIDHETGGHDDIANAIAGAIVLASADREQHIPFVKPFVCSNSNPTGNDPYDATDQRSTTRKFCDYYNGGDTLVPVWWSGTK